MDELPPFAGFGDEEINRSETAELTSETEVEPQTPEQVKLEVLQAESIDDLLRLMTQYSVRRLPSYAQAADLIEKINNYYRVNSTSVIVGEMVSEKMEEKNEAARGFAELYQSLGDPYGFGIKEKVKELLKVEMKKDFESDSFAYAKKAIEQVASVSQLKRVVGYFNKLKAKDLNAQKDAYFTGQEINQGIDNALDYLNRLIQFQGLANKGEDVIKNEVSNALMTIPSDNFGIKDKCETLFMDFVMSKRNDENMGRGLLGRFTKRFLSSRRG